MGVRQAGRTRWCERGQATVELALVLPLLLLVVWVGVEAGLLVRDQTLVSHGAREAARTLAVGGDGQAAVDAARARTGLTAGLEVAVVGAPPGGAATATVTLVERDRLPLLGSVVPGLTLRATVAMRVEDPAT